MKTADIGWYCLFLHKTGFSQMTSHLMTAILSD